MKKHEKLLTHFKGYPVGKGYNKAYRALNLMRKEFDGQMRKDGVTPTYAHSLEIAAFLRTYSFPRELEETLLITALLHDILEDTEYMSVDMQKDYGRDITEFVRALTKVSDYNNKAYYAGILIFLPAVIVKAADRIHNLSTMVGAFSYPKIESYIEETQEYVLPMLSEAKNLYPEHEAVFENMKFVILTQLEFAKAVVKQNTP